jgi:hypothetical protein
LLLNANQDDTRRREQFAKNTEIDPLRAAEKEHGNCMKDEVTKFWQKIYQLSCSSPMDAVVAFQFSSKTM